MKKMFFITIITCIVLVIASFKYKKYHHQGTQVLKKLELKRLSAVGCGANINLDDLEETYMPLLQGWGSYSFPVTTSSDSAQVYFNQGINMYYSFHIIEALGSFKMAAIFDPGCAMAYWGQALSFGPNINDFGYSASPEALTANIKAMELSASCTAKEKALINAIQVRYSADSTKSRETLNQLYADAMKDASEKIPDADIGALYADALMVMHPWDLYNQNSEPKLWTPEMVSVLEKTLRMSPKHPGANHYYIHAVEGSLNPGRALTAAKQLPELMPGVSHIVHMPSHIYIRTGNYGTGEAVNEQALKGYNNYLLAYPPVANAAFLYEMHNRHMQASCANMEGRFKFSLQASEACQKSIDPSYMDAPGYFGTYSQYVWMTPYFTLIRFGKWDDILKTKDVGEKWVYASVIYHYGRGLALARTHLPAEARHELELMQQAMEDSVMLISASTFNAPIAGAGVAERILQGVIAQEEKDFKYASAYLLKAVELEDQMMYNEPKDWPHPARHYLGNLLLKMGEPAPAEKVYRDDLTTNPNNGWALYGLWKALRSQNKYKEAEKVKALFDKAFAKVDVRIKGSVL